MSAPTNLPTWDSGAVNLIAPTSGHITSGYATNEIPLSSELNGQLNLIGQWIAYHQRNVTRNIFPTPLNASTVEWTVAYDGSPDGRELVLKYTGGLASDLTSPVIDLLPLQGYKLISLAVRVLGDATNNLLLNVEQTGNESDGTAISARTLAAPPASWTDYTVNIGNLVSALTITISASGGTYTRSTGSFLTDGFYVGQSVTWAGFSHSGNNGAHTITVLTASVMTVSGGGLTNETLTGTASVVPTTVSPTVDATFGLMLRLTPSANGATFSVKLIRATYMPT